MIIKQQIIYEYTKEAYPDEAYSLAAAQRSRLNADGIVAVLGSPYIDVYHVVVETVIFVTSERTN